MPPATLDLPPLRTLAWRAVPRFVEGALVPSLLFLGLLRVGGQGWAIAGALVWSCLVLGTRSAMRRRVPAIVLIGLGALAIRTALALWAQSSFVYFLQPTLGTAAVGMGFLASALVGRPLVLRLARDFCPLPDDVMAHGHLRRFFLGISVLWGAVQLLNAGLTLWVLLHHSLATLVLVRTTLGYGLTAAAIGVSVAWFRRVMRPAATPVPALAAP